MLDRCYLSRTPWPIVGSAA